MEESRVGSTLNSVSTCFTGRKSLRVWYLCISGAILITDGPSVALQSTASTWIGKRLVYGVDVVQMHQREYYFWYISLHSWCCLTRKWKITLVSACIRERVDRTWHDISAINNKPKHKLLIHPNSQIHPRIDTTSTKIKLPVFVSLHFGYEFFTPMERHHRVI